MYLSDSIQVLLRRWYVLLAGGILLVGLGAVLMAKIPSNYQASGELLLLPPSELATPQQTRTNPYLELEPEVTAALIGSTVMATDVVRQMEDAGFSGDYTAAVVPETGPLIALTVQDSDAARAISTRDELIRRMEEELANVQDSEDVPDGRLITTRAFSVAAEAEPLSGGKLPALALLFTLGGSLTLAIAFRLDRRSRTRAEQARADVDLRERIGAQDTGPGTGASVEPADHQVDPARAHAQRAPGSAQGTPASRPSDQARPAGATGQEPRQSRRRVRTPRAKGEAPSRGSAQAQPEQVPADAQLPAAQVPVVDAYATLVGAQVASSDRSRNHVRRNGSAPSVDEQ